jgi:hypothetical protein
MPWLLILPLSLLVYEDFKHRAIHLFWLLLIISIAFWKMTINIQWVCINGLFIAFQGLVLTLYFSLKNRALTLITNEYLGIGDLLYFLVICFLFNPVQLINYFIFSLVFSLTVFGLMKVFLKDKVLTVPLAGLMALFLILNIITENIFNYHLLTRFKI